MGGDEREHPRALVAKQLSYLVLQLLSGQYLVPLVVQAGSRKPDFDPDLHRLTPQHPEVWRQLQAVLGDHLGDHLHLYWPNIQGGPC